MQPNPHPLVAAASLIKEHVATINRDRKFCEHCGHTLQESNERYQEVVQLEAMIRKLRQFAAKENTK